MHCYHRNFEENTCTKSTFRCWSNMIYQLKIRISHIFVVWQAKIHKNKKNWLDFYQFNKFICSFERFAIFKNGGKMREGWQYFQHTSNHTHLNTTRVWTYCVAKRKMCSYWQRIWKSDKWKHTSIKMTVPLLDLDQVHAYGNAAQFRLIHYVLSAQCHGTQVFSPTCCCTSIL